MIGMIFFFSQTVIADDESDLDAMQQQLNNEVINKPFFAEQADKVDAYIKSAMEKNIKPKEYTGSYWQRGYTCHNLLQWSWQEYRNCRYYHRYYGRYYY